MGVIEVEKPVGVVVAFGGQTAIYADRISGQARHHASWVPLPTALTWPRTADRFDALLEDLNIRRPKGMSVTNLEEAPGCFREAGLPRAAASLLRHRWPEHDHCPR